MQRGHHRVFDSAQAPKVVPWRAELATQVTGHPLEIGGAAPFEVEAELSRFIGKREILN